MQVYLTTQELAATEEVALLRDIAFPQYVHWFPDSYARTASGLQYPPHKIAQRALTPAVRESISAAAAQDGRTAFLLAAGNTNFVGMTPRKFQPDGPLAYTYRLLPLSLTNIYAARVAQELGCTDHIATDSTACVSAVKSMMDAFALIRLHGYERVVILAVEDQINTVMLEFFGETRAVLTLADMEQSATQPSAFDPVNHGFFIGQGAAIALFETEASMRAGGREPLAELKSASVVAERHGNAVGQREDGAGYASAIRSALRMAGLESDAIDLIKTHGTGTLSNNVSEAAGIEAAFGTHFTATSYKARIGHTMGASGLIELLLALRDARAGIARGILHRTGGDPRFLTQDTPMRVRHLLALASGMGNVYGAAICQAL